MQLLEIYERALCLANTNRNCGNALHGQHSRGCQPPESETLTKFLTRDKPLGKVLLESA